MKRIRLFLALAAVVLGIGLTSCNQNDPSQADLFTGKYVGPISYTEPGQLFPKVTSATGTVTVTKVGDSYSFFFSNDIPSITNVKMAKGEKTSLSLAGGGTGIINITGETLNIGYKNEKGGWTAKCKRK